MQPPDKNINKTRTGKRVLVAPLDWGLGHATRCVPVIRELLYAGFEVLIAAGDAGKALLEKEFPQLKILSLSGYQIRYSKSGKSFLFKMIGQLFKIQRAINHENKWLKKMISEHKIEIVISDNRLGLHAKDTRCIFITHQLFIKAGNRIFEKMAQKINYKYINQFDECWVPDMPGEENFAGLLSHPKKKPAVPVRYIGILSRFRTGEKDGDVDIAVILSGPEPQRTLLENILLPQLSSSSVKTVLVRGLPGTDLLPTGEANIQIFNHLSATDMNELLLNAKNIIARSGYSTIMDLVTLNRRAILIPTPGQPEQEYLAGYLSAKNYFIEAAQKNFDLKDVLKKKEEETFKFFAFIKNDLLREAVTALK